MRFAKLLQKTCLRQNISLRRQLLTSFGSAAFLTLALVVAVSIISLNAAGNVVRVRSSNVMREHIHQLVLATTRSSTEMFGRVLLNTEGVVHKLAEVIQDRIVGYPRDGWEADIYVPFFDMDSGTNVYPLKTKPVPLDWQITLDITEKNRAEVMPQRENWFDFAKGFATYSTSTFIMQGQCDPRVTDPDHPFFYPNCTDANNNVETGGAVNPTTTAKGLYSKSGDLSVLMRALYESSPEIINLGVYFVNSGAGAAIEYPGHFLDGSVSYESIGCDWLREENPNTGEQLASENEIARCHPNGTKVSSRDYNPLERWWFRDITLSGDITWVGPYKAAGVDIFLLTVGKPIYDRRTGSLIGVVTADYAWVEVNKVLNNSALNGHSSQWAIISMDDGRVLANSLEMETTFNVPSGEKIYLKFDMGRDMVPEFSALKSTYERLFSGEWTDQTLADAASAAIQECKEGIITAYPLPPPPKTFNQKYKPHSLAVQFFYKDVYNPIYELESSISADVLHGSIGAVGIGVFGMFIILVILWCVARVLTQPLLWMELVSWRIVNHGDKRSGNDLCAVDLDDFSATVRCSPRTEITELVEEFLRMIKEFSGSGASTVAESEPNEVRNTLTWQSDFRQLYTKGMVKMKSNRSNITAQTPPTEPEENSENPEDENGNNISGKIISGNNLVVSLDGTKVSKLVSNTVFPAPPKENFGPVTARLPEDTMIGFEETKDVFRSRLFRWIVVLIVVPLILTNTAIAVIVTTLIKTTVPSWVDELRSESMDLEIAALDAVARSTAALVAGVMQDPVRDLLWSARIANWLHFGALPRASSFTEVFMLAEQCKSYKPGTCPVLRSYDCQCPCNWNDTGVQNCTWGVNQSEARRLQKRFFEVLAQGADPLTGNRSHALNYNETAYSPETTVWRNNISLLPGANKGQSAAGFETTYDRARVSSAIAVVEFPIYNYQQDAGNQRQYLGSYLAFAADGAITGWNGCSHSNTFLASFVSSRDNSAFEVDDGLCPEGKYGFDARCRHWFSKTRDAFFSSREMMYLTPPYVFIDGIIGLTAGTPIANPMTGDMAGVMILDFVPWGLTEALSTWTSSRDSQLMKAFGFLITPEQDVYGGDTVVGPNMSKPWSPTSILDELFPFDGKDSALRADFNRTILRNMKMGRLGLERFFRKNADGEIEELVAAYYPVNQTIITPLDPTSLARGVNVSVETIYSVGLGSFIRNMMQPLVDVERTLSFDLGLLAIVEVSLVLFLSIVFLVIVCIITIHVTRPMITLLSAVRSINSKKGARYSIAPLSGGSREVHQVYNSFSKLYKVVRISNTAFFSGNLVWADHIVTDAIQLFRKIDDRKAIGIACNNRGNILFARTQELGRESESCLNYGFGACAAEHYDEAVLISQEGFDKAESVEAKADFARELADRLFNRGMFLLFIEREADAPENARERGLADIMRARDLDYDVKDFYMENKFLLQFSDDFFARMLRRIHGLCIYYEDEDVRNIWDPSRLLEEADELLYAAWFEKSAPLFRDINRIGRLQQLEAAATRVEGCRGNHREAARVGIRMFAEDEYLLEGPFLVAADALLHLAKSGDGAGWSRKTVSSVHSDLSKMTRACRSRALDLGKCVVFAFELNERLEGEPIFPLINEKCMKLFENHCTDEDYVGMVAYTVSGDHTLELALKGENEGQQRAVLDRATKSTSERVCGALPYAMQVVLDSFVSQEMVTYILLFTDGYSWDSESYMSIKWQISRMNRENESEIHLIVLGVDVEPEYIEDCKSLCTVSKGSFFVELTEDNINETFSSICSTFSSGRLHQQFMRSSTMETF